MPILGNTISFLKSIGYCQYLSTRRIGYWRYLSIHRMLPFWVTQNPFIEWIFAQKREVQGQKLTMIGSWGVYFFSDTFKGKWSHFIADIVPKCKQREQKERFKGTFDVTQRTR